jgi:hypothetical protein
MRLFAGTLCFTLMLCSKAAAQGTDFITRGYLAGQAAGRRESMMLPFALSSGTVVTLAAIDGKPMNNNRVVTAAVTQAAIGAGVSLVASLVFKTRPARADRIELARVAPEYSEAWHRGFKEATSGRSLAANALGVVVGAVIAGVIYHSRLPDDAN